MTKQPTYGMPGLGGSLGKCALCGDTFILEILLNKTVKAISVDGCDQTLYAHKTCLKKWANKRIDPTQLPEASPLRAAWLEAKNKSCNQTPTPTAA